MPSYTIKYNCSEYLTGQVTTTENETLEEIWTDGSKKVLDTHMLKLDEDSFVYIRVKRHASSTCLEDFPSEIVVSQKDTEFVVDDEDTHASAFLKKGTHKIKTKVGCADPFDDVTGSTDVYVLTIPLSKAIKVSKKVSSNKGSATVTVKSNLGSYADRFYIKRGSINGKIGDVYDMDTMQSVSYGKVRAKVTRNGKYTIVVSLKGYIYDDEAQYGKRTITVSGIKKSK